jgi:hypothetical protein
MNASKQNNQRIKIEEEYFGDTCQLTWYQLVDMEMYIQKAYYMYYCVLFAFSITTYFWYFFDESYKTKIDWGIMRVSWFVQSFVFLIIQIILCDYLIKRVSRSYLRTYRCVRRNKQQKKRKRETLNSRDL